MSQTASSAHRSTVRQTTPAGRAERAKYRVKNAQRRGLGYPARILHLQRRNAWKKPSDAGAPKGCICEVCRANTKGRRR